jgi:hypothetical protein
MRRKRSNPTSASSSALAPLPRRMLQDTVAVLASSAATAEKQFLLWLSFEYSLLSLLRGACFGRSALLSEATSQFVGLPRTAAPRLLSARFHARQSARALVTLPPTATKTGLIRSLVARSGFLPRLMPNPSLEPTHSGKRRKPGMWHSVHHHTPGLRRSPARAAQLKR